MKKKMTRWSALVLAVTVLVQAAFTGIPLNVQAAETSSSELHKELGEPYYYDLADGNYYLAGTEIMVNGESMASGSTLDISGEYNIQRTSTDGRTLAQDIILYRRGDVRPDGKLDAKDLVALKRYQNGEELPKAGLAAVELSDDPFVDDADSKIIRQLLVGDQNLVKDGDWKNYKSANTSLSYNSGISDAVMPIGGFTGPAYDEITEMPDGALNITATDAVYKLVSDVGINLITTTPNKLADTTSVEDVMRDELALAEKYGIDMYVNLSYLNDTSYQTKEMMDQYLKEYSSYASFKGISLGDEPEGDEYGSALSNPAMDAYSEIGKLLHEYTNLTGYTNLLPYWAKHGTEDQYKQYLEDYITKYNPKQISLDYYVWGDTGRGDNASKEEYFKNLAMIKEAADNAGIPFWIICQAGGHFNEDKQYVSTRNYYPTKGETLWNVNTALAYGAQGITYYPLVQPVEYSQKLIGNDYNRNGLIGADGTTTNFYEYAKRANEQILSVDHVLMQAQNKGIMVTAGSTAATEVGTTIATYKGLQSVTSTGTAGAIVGCFDYLSTTALYVVNYDADAEQTITLKFDKDYTLAITQDGVTSTAATSGYEYGITLTAGEGVLVLVNDPDVTNVTSVNSVCAAIDALPALADSEMPRDYTNVVAVKKSYDNLNAVERAQITEAQKAKLQALYETTINYGVVYDEAIAGGTRDIDSVYGNITVINATDVTVFADNLLETNIDSKYGDVVFYVYNPTDGDVNATYGDASCTLKANAWTKMTVAATNFVSGNDLTLASSVSGQWKITDYYGVNNGDLLERVIAMIEALPDPMLVKLSDKDAIANARAMYDALSNDKASVTNYQKLLECEARLEVLEAEAAGELPVVIDVAERAYGIDNETDTYVTDETYGTVMEFADATYFAIHKDQMTEAYKAARMAMVYIYNPTSENAYIRTQLGDNGWIKGNFVTLYPGQWNRVELFDRGATHTSGDASFVENYLTAGETIYFYAVNSTGEETLSYAGEGWKVSSVYGINEYNSSNVKDCDVVLDVSQTQLSIENGTDVTNVENTAFGTVLSFSSAKNFALTNENKGNIFKLCKDVATYIYNPTETAVIMSITVDWKYYEYFQLMPKAWNRILISDFLPQSEEYTRNMISTTEAIWFDAQSGDNTFPADTDGEKWMISNFYGIPVNLEAIQEVKQAIIAMPWADELTVQDIPTVENVKALYDGLSDLEKTYLTTEEAEKLNACVAKIPELEMSVVGTYIDALPDAKDIETEANIMKYYAEIQKVKGLYDGLSEEGKGLITAEQKEKLDACVAKVANYTLLLPAAEVTMIHQPDCNCESDIAIGNDSAYGSVWEINITKAGTINGYVGCFQIETDLSGKEEVFFWLYNPQSEKQTMWLYADNWEVAGGGSMEPGWNRVSITSEVNSRIFGLITTGTGVGTWKVSSIFSSSRANIVVDMIAALPEVDKLTLEDKEAVEAAKAAYDELDAASQARVTNIDKLNACLSKLAELETPSEPDTDAKLSGIGFDGWSSNSETWIGSNGDYAERLAVEAVESFQSQPAILHATINHKADGSSANFVANSLDMFYSCQSTLGITKEEVQSWIDAGYTKMQFNYYLTGSGTTTIWASYEGKYNESWDYYLNVVAEKDKWATFEIALSDILIQLDSSYNSGYLFRVQPQTEGTYEFYLGTAKAVKETVVELDTDAKLSGIGFDGWSSNSETWIGSNGDYAERLSVEAVESFQDQPAILHATINHKADGSSANFVANSLDMFYSCHSTLGITKEEVQSWIDAGYTKMQFSYYLTGSGTTTIWASYEGKYNGSWDNYLNVVAEKDKWATFEIALSDILIQLDSSYNSGYLFRVQPQDAGTYEFYLGSVKGIK